MSKLENVSEIFNKHVIECIVYRNVLPDSISHWCDEIGSWLNYANDLTCSSKLKEKDYLTTFFSDFGDELSDCRINLKLYQTNNRKLIKRHSDDAYPDFEISSELAEQLFKFSSKIIQISLPILVSKDVLSSEEWSSKVHELLDTI